MTLRSATRAACAATAALALALTSVGAAEAAPRAHAAKHAGHRHHLRKLAKPAAFSVHGVVTAVSGDRVRVVVGHGRVGGHAVGHRVITLTVTKRTHRHNTAKVRHHARGRFAAHAATVDPVAIPVGTTIDATGVASGSTLTVTSEVTKPVPAETLYGVVERVSGSVAYVRAADEVRGDHELGEEDELKQLDLAAATLNGAAHSAAEVKPGQYVVALGEEDEDVMAVADASFFTDAPRIVMGEVTASDGVAKSLTVAAKDDREDAQGEEETTEHNVVVDASDALVVVNGSQLGAGAEVPSSSFPAVGDKVLVVAPPSSVATTSVAASLVFAFDRHDEGAAGDNEGGQD